jgi:DnaJ-class molecular chaperone
MICQNCKGNGYIRVSWEAEKSIEQCKVCNSQGEIKDDEHFKQTWDDGNGSASLYFGPPLEVEEGDGFKNYKIYPK